MLSAILTITILALLFGLLLGYAAVKFHIEGDPVADQIDSLLPQTQCGQCGHPGCRPYADAIAAGEDDINKCAPGGEETIIALADLLGRDPIPMDESIEERPPSVARIKENECIGCTLCIQACPVDAILGAAKQMHTVIESECTGCELCLPPCPVECIVMEPIHATYESWSWPYPMTAHRNVAQAQEAS
jgi:electron transport complex protein RnfB